jgi:ribulose 1,5-bisphosphate synthetase/thiazole synthase
MGSSPTFYFVALLLGFAHFTLAAPTNNPVCIVGAGPAGLIAANRLESQGQQTVIFEKQLSVGGKCQAIYAE